MIIILNIQEEELMLRDNNQQCKPQASRKSRPHRPIFFCMFVGNGKNVPLWPLPAVRDLTRDGRWSTYDESVLKLSKVSFRGKCARTGHPLKLPPPTKLARLGHFPPATQVGRLAGPVFYVYIFSLGKNKKK
jgi:hypothetical protein